MNLLNNNTLRDAAALFNAAPAPQGRLPIVVTGHVLSDGKGDYFHMTTLVKKLHKSFPERKIHLIAASDGKHSGKLPLLQIENVATHLIYCGRYTAGVKPHIAPEEFPGADILQIVKEAGVILSGPIDLAGTFDSVQEEIKPKKIAYFEYDMGKESDGTSAIELRTGLGEQSLGIFLKKRKNYALNDLENEQLRNLLGSNPLFFCYVTQHPAAFKFISQILAYSPAQKIDVCYPARYRIEPLHLESCKEIWMEQGIGTIKLIQQQEEITLNWGPGRELCIIDAGLLSPKDFEILTAISDPLMGCTGDASLALALSYEKIPFYDVGNKTQLLHNLAVIANKECPLLGRYLETQQESAVLNVLNISMLQTGIKMFKEWLASHDPQEPLYDYSKNTYKRILLSGKEIEEAQREIKELRKDSALDMLSLSAEELKTEAKNLSRYLRAHYSFAPLFRAVIKEALMREENPSFARAEDELYERYQSGIITQEEYLSGLKSLLT